MYRTNERTTKRTSERPTDPYCCWMDDSYLVRSFSFRFSYLFGWFLKVRWLRCVCVLFFFSSVYSMFFSVVPSFPTSSSVGPCMRLGSVRFVFYFFFFFFEFCLLYAFLSLYLLLVLLLLPSLLLLLLLFCLLKSRIRIVFISLSLSFAQCKAQIGGKCFGFTLWWISGV